MVIFDAQSFGLATLHQLRGRIGRGGQKGNCFLVCTTSEKLARQRLQYLEDNEDGNLCWFIKPYDGEIKDDSIVVSDQVRPSPYWIRNIYDTNFPNPRLNTVLQNFRESNIFDATDLCGTDFKQVIDFSIRK